MDFIELISLDRNIILYRPELNEITGGVTSSILLHQFIFRAKNADFKPFYKFKQPCKHKLYREGDSWCEELGFSPKEFDTALSKIGYKVGNVDNQIQKEDAFILYYINGERVTYYELNKEVLNNRLFELYAIRHLGNNAIRDSGFTKVNAIRDLLSKRDSGFTYNTETNKTDTTTKEDKRVMSPEGDTPAFEVLNEEAGMQKTIQAQKTETEQKTINAQESKNEGAGVNDLIKSKSEENSLFNNNDYTNKLVASTARKTFEGLSGVMQTRVLEVVNAFREITGKKDSLTKERLGCIVARLKEDASINGEDVKIQISHFKAVFEYMNAKWCNDTKMKQYVQIETFCSQKMHKYLEEATVYLQTKENALKNSATQTPTKKKKTLIVV